MSDTLQPVIVHPRLQDVRHSTFPALAPHPCVLSERSDPPLLQPASDRRTMPAANATGAERSRWGFMRGSALEVDRHLLDLETRTGAQDASVEQDDEAEAVAALQVDLVGRGQPP